MKERLEHIADQDGRYPPDAIRFVYEGLGYTTKNILHEPDHVNGQTLCKGLCQMSIERYGRLAKLVLNSWNIHNTRDFGEIVYLMIQHKWMSAQPTDTIEDFDDVFDFDTAFKKKFRFRR